MSINWQLFGSNGQEKADYSRGVLERFTRRAPKDWAPNPTKTGDNALVKVITLPRKINFIWDPHHYTYFEGYYSVNETGAPVWIHLNFPITAEKIVLNHYHTKSREEYLKKLKRGAADHNKAAYESDNFECKNRNEEVDDGILKYRDERAKNFRLPDKSHADERLLAALMENLLPTLVTNTPPEFYSGKMETFLTCRAVASYLKTKLTDELPTKFFEDASLKAIIKSLESGVSLADIRLLLRELPKLLPLPYPAVKEIRVACLNIIPQITELLRLNSSINRYYLYNDLVNLDYIRRLLQTWK